MLVRYGVLAGIVSLCLVSQASGRALVSCDNDGQLRRLAHPSVCNFPVSAPPGRAGAADAGHIYVKKMRSWHHWGANRTKVRGTFVGNMNYTKRITVKLFGRTKCEVPGHGSFFVYTLAKFRGLGGQTGYVGGC